MHEESYLSKAKRNIVIAETILKIPDGDEHFCNEAGYHLQQAAELFIKHQFEQYGLHSWGHDIESLIREAKEADIPLILTDYVIDHAEQLSSWESKTRYIKAYLVERQSIEKMIPELRESIFRYEKDSSHEWTPPSEDPN